MDTYPSKNLIWDLGNTLLKINVLSFIKHIGPLDVLLYLLIDQKNPTTLYHRALDLLDKVNVPHENSCQATIKGRPVPPVMCLWFTGHIPHKEISSFLKTPLRQRVPEGFFSSDREARLTENLIKIFTNPQALASSITLINEGVSLLSECAEQYNSNGTQRHNLFILSNWDPYSFPELYNSLHLKSLFQHFEKSKVIISGKIGLIKPHDEIYSYLLSTYKLNPKDCILIDDQSENLHGARKHGIMGILLKNNNYQHIRNELKKNKVIV